MIRKFLLCTMLGAAMLVGGCVTNGGGGSPPTSDVIKQVQDAVKQACAFVPTAQTVLHIFDVGGFGSYADLAAMICKAVNSVSVRRGAVSKPSIVLKGQRVVIEGRRVSR